MLCYIVSATNVPYKSELAKTVIERLAEIYAIEAQISGTSAEHRLSVRQAKTKDLMADLKVLLMDTIKDISAKDPVASAIKGSEQDLFPQTR